MLPPRVHPLPTLARLLRAVPARRAVLAANMETALNAHWDAGSGPADRIVVVGGGVLGLLVAWLAARLPVAEGWSAGDGLRGRATSSRSGPPRDWICR